MTIGFLLKFSQAVVGIYTDDQSEITLLMSVYPLYLAELFASMVYTAIFGAILAMGYQGTATVINIVAYWAIMLPLSYVLSNKSNWEFVGIWVGPPIASFILMVGYMMIVYFAPWEKISEEAVKSSE